MKGWYLRVEPEWDHEDLLMELDYLTFKLFWTEVLVCALFQCLQEGSSRWDWPLAMYDTMQRYVKLGDK